MFFNVHALIAQNFDEKTFFENMQKNYYSLEQTSLKNYVALVQNDGLKKIAAIYWKNDEIFPMQVIWVRPQNIYLTQQGVPALPDSVQKKYDALVVGLKKQIEGLMVDLNRFYTSGIYSDIPVNYTIKESDRFVLIQFDKIFGKDTTHNDYYFGKNGLLLKVESFSPQTKRRITTHPFFKIHKTQWICTGWEVQMWENQQIKTGYVVKIELNNYKNIWIPYTIEIAVKKAEQPDQTFIDHIYFRNYIFNKSLQIINR